MKTVKKYQIVAFLLLTHFLSAKLQAQDANTLLEKVRAKLNKVEDYAASGTMKTDVVFIKIPIAPIESFYVKPDKFQITRKSGVSLLPKGGIGINIGSLILTNNFTVIDAGDIVSGRRKLKILKLIPLSDLSTIVLTTLHVDPVEHLIHKVSTTTRENGTYDLEMFYGKYLSWGLPDKVIFHFNTKDYKLPKGITFEYDDGTPVKDLPKNKKGKVEIVYNNYTVNKGLGKKILTAK